MPREPLQIFGLGIGDVGVAKNELPFRFPSQSMRGGARSTSEASQGADQFKQGHLIGVRTDEWLDWIAAFY